MSLHAERVYEIKKISVCLRYEVFGKCITETPPRSNSLCRPTTGFKGQASAMLIQAFLTKLTAVALVAQMNLLDAPFF